MEKENIVLTVGHQNLRGFIVSVETITRRGIFQFDIIGLANKTISESKQRILSAIACVQNQKRHYINKKITTLLSPADSKKEGSHFDLPIAISYLISNNFSTSKNVAKAGLFSNVITLGELTLTGFILPIKHISIFIRTGVQKGISHFVIPKENEHEVPDLDNIFVWPIAHISEIINILNEISSASTDIQGRQIFINKFQIASTSSKLKTNITVPGTKDTNGDGEVDKGSKTRQDQLSKYMLDSISGNKTAKRALQISLAGKHHILFIGTPGSGKSLLAKSSKELLPSMNIQSANVFQLQQIDESLGLSKNINQPPAPFDIKPFREPHHTSSYTEIIGNNVLPGEIALAHGGILFLDELSEFNRRVLESLRQPLENKYIQRNQGELIPTDFLLIACMNPCECGYHQSKQKRCICARSQIDKYLRKMNSPLFQRFDMCIHVQAENKIKGASGPGAQRGDSARVLKGHDVVENILRTREQQAKRLQDAYKKYSQARDASSETINIADFKSVTLEIDLKNLKELRAKERTTLDEISGRFSFSKREEMSVLRVARTIADLDESKNILEKHLFEASSYRLKN